jgi:hypothetical protein
MDSQKASKINQLVKAWPKGTLAVYNWLVSQGVYRQLVGTYIKGSWIDRIGRGAFKRAGETVDWMGALYAIQTQLKLSVHAAGKTALGLQGYAHYVPLGAGQTVVLFGGPGEKLPEWFRRFDWKVKIRYTATGFLDVKKGMGLTDHVLGDYSIQISSPERAMLEVCYDAPDEESYEEAGLLMEGLTTLRPELVQELLRESGSIKAKRLFMHLAEKKGHTWVKKLDLKKVDFGSGKRMLGKHGTYDSKYQIVVPAAKEGT